MSPNYDPTSDPFGIDLRNEFDAIMRDHGTWGLLRKRTGNRKKAASYNPTTAEAAPGERAVLQSGESFIDYLVRYRRMGLFDVPEAASSVGREGPALVRFYVQWHMRPDPHDFIAEIAQDESSRQRSFQIQPVAPFQITKLWDIQEVTPMRERGGRVEFWQVLCREAVLGGPS